MERLDEVDRRAAHVAEVPEGDAPLAPEAADHGGQVVAEEREVALAEADRVGLAVGQGEHALERLDADHDPAHAAQQRDRRIVRMQGQPHARLLGDRHDLRQEVLEGLPELLGRHVARPRSARPHVGQPESGDERVAAPARADGRARPVDAGHPVVTEHRNAQPAHVADERAEVPDLLVAPGQAEPRAVHGRPVLDAGDPQPGALVALLEPRERLVVPGPVARVVVPAVGRVVELRDHGVDADLADDLPELDRPRAEVLGDLQHRW